MSSINEENTEYESILYTPSTDSTTTRYYSETATPSPDKNSKQWIPINGNRRILRKSGVCNLRKIHVSVASSKKNVTFHFQDMFTSMVELRWRWIFLIFSFIHIFSWYIFAAMWWIVAYNHGDLYNSDIEDQYNDTEPCVIGVRDFISSFMFSMESQYTTGYGSRVPTTQCPEAIFLISLQNIFGSLINSITLGLVFTKAARPKARKAAILFSDFAVICMRDGQLCLLFRVADVRKSKIINSDIKASFFSPYRTFEGEYIPLFQRKLKLSVDAAGSDVCFMWPLTLCHIIDHNSPLFHMSALDMLKSRFEIVVCLTGTLETTGQLMEAKTSYLPSEIIWGHQFQPMAIKLPAWKNCYVMDYCKFQETRTIDTPICSAQQLYEYSNPNSPPISTKKSLYHTLTKKNSQI